MAGAEIAVRLAQYAALTLLFGLSAMRLYAPVEPMRRGLTISLAVVAALASLAGLLLLAALLAEDPAILLSPSGTWSMVTAMGAGLAGLARLGLLAALATIPPLWRPWPTRLMSGLALASLAWSGHAAAGEGALGLLQLAADSLHLLAAGVWIGALAGFVALVWPGRSVANAERALSSFSGVGTACVALLLATGLINLFADTQGRPLTALGHSAWGVLLVVKLAGVAAMLGLASLNRWVLTPRLRAGGRPVGIRLSLTLEFGLGLGVLLLVAILGRLSPLGDG
ncbi:putative copper resistance protein D [Caulobacter ginsengisoli]|uniref:Copper resistance protein D n=1 Tax=Caulobacter ginsengisoli TaxID=400775 RepID=A0ABU0IRE7_9CAUL|nr:CopD family protein [Caulobacter ginsengisoli]MDQ0464592.1 putative copper resistance protein D [Caulobacter ginsengisoli]